MVNNKLVEVTIKVADRPLIQSVMKERDAYILVTSISKWGDDGALACVFTIKDCLYEY
jgi:hypothetical protein